MSRRHAHADERPQRRRSVEEQLEGLSLFAEPLAVTLPVEPPRTPPRPMPVAYAPGSDTSQDAAEAIAGRAELLRARVLRRYLTADLAGMTADECAQQLQESVLSIRPRVTELVQLGWLEKTKERRQNESGATATVHIITDKGRARAHALIAGRRHRGAA